MSTKKTAATPATIPAEGVMHFAEGEVVDANTPALEVAADTSTALAIAPATLAGLVRAGDDGLAEFNMADIASEGVIVGGTFEGPYWVPQLGPKFTRHLSAEGIAEALKKKGGDAGPEAVIVNPQLLGRLTLGQAWGRRAHFVEVIQRGKIVRVLVPDHSGLRVPLNNTALGSTVAIRYDGEGKAKPQKAAPQLYTVVVVGRGQLNEPRADAVQPESQDQRKARIAYEEAIAAAKEKAIARQRARLLAEAERAAEADAEDDDGELPF